jgi:hypothetical protein
MWRTAGAATVVVLVSSSFTPATAIAATRSTVRIHATPELLYGASGTVSGRVLSHGSGVHGKHVVVYYRKAGADHWSRLARLRTSRTGRYRLATHPGTNTRYFARFPGTSARRGASSTAVATLVRPYVTLTASATTVTAGQTVSLTTTVKPVHAGMTITYQWLDGALWKNLSTATLNSASQHAVSFSVPRVASYWFRVVLPGHRDHSEGRAVANVVGVAPAPAPPALPPATPPAPAVFDAQDTPPGGYPSDVATPAGYGISGGTDTCSTSGTGEMAVTAPSVGDDSAVIDYYRNNFWVYDPVARQWTFLSSGRWNANHRFLGGSWYDVETGVIANSTNYQFTPGFYYGVTQSVIDGLSNVQYELAIPFLAEASPYFACRM